MARHRGRRAVRLTCFALAGAGAVAVAPHAVAATETFGFTGAAQSWTVPAGVSSATLVVSGAQGGDFGGSSGGLGGRVTATVGVAPGEILQINVGGAGANGGFNGGDAAPCGGAGGGGASDVRRDADGDMVFELGERLLGAGGGGGAAGTAGGAGAGATGGVGGTGAVCGGTGGTGGNGGILGGGGAGGTGGAGGDGGNGGSGGILIGSGGAGGRGGAGGGGGLFGSGGDGGTGGSGAIGGDGGSGGLFGEGTGGSGGSGFAPAGAEQETGVRSGAGLVEVTYAVAGAPDTTPPVLRLPAGLSAAAAAAAGTELTYVATALDDTDGPTEVACAPASGALFPVGVTAVTCEAWDAAGNVANGTFAVIVTFSAPPGEVAPSAAPAPAAGCPTGTTPFLPTLGPWRARPKLSSPCYRLVRTGVKNRIGRGRFLLLDARFHRPGRAGGPTR